MNEKMILNKKTSSVLLITEDIAVQKLIAAFLSDAEIGFNTASTITQASKLLKDNKIELILFDIKTDSLKDYNALKKLTENPDFKMPVVVLANELPQEEVKKYFNLGINGCLSKPVSKMDLAGIMTQFLPDFIRLHSS